MPTSGELAYVEKNGPLPLPLPLVLLAYASEASARAE